MIPPKKNYWSFRKLNNSRKRSVTILVLVTNYNIYKITFAQIMLAFRLFWKKTMFKARRHGLQFKLKRPSHWTCSQSKSKKQSLSKVFCWRYYIALISVYSLQKGTNREEITKNNFLRKFGKLFGRHPW